MEMVGEVPRVTGAKGSSVGGGLEGTGEALSCDEKGLGEVAFSSPCCCMLEGIPLPCVVVSVASFSISSATVSVSSGDFSSLSGTTGGGRANFLLALT